MPQISDPMSNLLGLSINCRMENEASLRNAKRFLYLSRPGLLLVNILYIPYFIEMISVASDLMEIEGHNDKKMAYNLGVLFSLLTFTMNSTICAAGKQVLEQDRDKKATTYFVFPSSISLFGWQYMKLKFLIMMTSLNFLLNFAMYETKATEEIYGVNDNATEDKVDVDVTVLLITHMLITLASLVVYLSLYHSMKRMDDDDRHNVFPDHDFSNDKICALSGSRLPFWIIYSIVLIGLVVEIMSILFGDLPEGGTNTLTIFMAVVLFGLMGAHQLFYSFSDTQVQVATSSQP